MHSPPTADSAPTLRLKLGPNVLALFALGLAIPGLFGLLEWGGLLGGLWVFGPAHRLAFAFHVALLGLSGALFAASRVYPGRLPSWVGGSLSLALAFLIVGFLPESRLTSVVPQAFWLPVVLSLVTSNRRWSAATLVVSILFAAFRFGHLPLFSLGINWVVTLLLGVLLFGFRTLHERTLAAHLAAQNRARLLERHDQLTRIPNRAALQQHLLHHADRRAVDTGHVAIIVIGVDRFLALNEMHGTTIADLYLARLPELFRTRVREQDFLARLGGDKFVLLVEGLPDLSTIERISSSLLQIGREELNIDDRPVRATLSIGVATWPADGADLTLVLRQAEQALQQAKSQGRDQVVWSSPEAHRAHLRRSRLAMDLRKALSEHQLHLVYQPIFDLRSGKLCRAEALLRWTHPEEGPISPAEFIPIAESTGLIVEIGDWVFREAASQCKKWRSAGARGFQVSVNRSPVQFLRDPEGPHQCVETLKSLDLAPDAVAIELTESVLIDSPLRVEAHLRALRSAGLALYLDDFGTGYSSLSRLHDFDLDVLKIDRSFVMHLAPGSKELLLCQGIIRLAASLNLRVVAEGVETAEQQALLTAAGCDYGQGWHLGRPVSAEVFERRLFGEAQRPDQTSPEGIAG